MWDRVLVRVLMLLPNTEIFLEGVKKKQANLKKWIDFSLSPTPDFRVDYWTEYMSEKQLGKLQKEAYRSFYMRPKYIFRSILSIRSLFELKVKLRGVASLFR